MRVQTPGIETLNPVRPSDDYVTVELPELLGARYEEPPDTRLADDCRSAAWRTVQLWERRLAEPAASAASRPTSSSTWARVRKVFSRA